MGPQRTAKISATLYFPCFCVILTISSPGIASSFPYVCVSGLTDLFRFYSNVLALLCSIMIWKITIIASKQMLRVFIPLTHALTIPKFLFMTLQITNKPIKSVTIYWALKTREIIY